MPRASHGHDAILASSGMHHLTGRFHTVNHQITSFGRQIVAFAGSQSLPLGCIEACRAQPCSHVSASTGPSSSIRSYPDGVNLGGCSLSSAYTMNYRNCQIRVKVWLDIFWFLPPPCGGAPLRAIHLTLLDSVLCPWLPVLNASIASFLPIFFHHDENITVILILVFICIDTPPAAILV